MVSIRRPCAVVVSAQMSASDLKPAPALAIVSRILILNEPDRIQERGSWQHAAELMILAAERGGSIEAATIQIENALFLEARYVRP